VNDPTLAAQVRHHRVTARLTQAELAERAGLSERAISDIERGLRMRIYPVTARALSDALGLADEQRATFERAAQAGRKARDTDPTSDSSHASVSGQASELRGADHWRAMRRSPMVGRSDDLTFLLSLLSDGGPRLHTITGPGGIGKSRLAAEVCAARIDSGVTWVSLAAVQHPEFVLSTIAAVAGLPRDASPIALASALDEGTSLLVLDTFEPVLAAANEVAAMLDLTTRLRVLVTSRAPLRVRGERELLLRPLSPTDATELFRQRVQAARPDLVVHDADAVAAIEEISRRLFGLPLALELAAAKVRHISLSALRARLDRPLELLEDGERDLPPRQQTMRAALGWSYDLLPPVERALFPRLGVFVDGWTFDAAVGVCAGDDVPAATMMSTLGVLCEHGLVQPDDTAVERWRLLDPIRDYALERLDDTGERRPTEHRHAHVFAQLAERSAVGLIDARQGASRAELRAEVGNLRLALAWAIDAADADVALRISSSIWMFWRMESAFTEGRRWLQLALQLPDAYDSPSRSRALWGAAWLAYQQGDPGTAVAYGNELLAASATGDAAIDRRNALTILGHIAVGEGRPGEAVPLLEEALDIVRALGRQWHVATSLLNLGTALLHQTDYLRAQHVLEEAVTQHEAAGDQLFAARSRVELGYAALVRADLTQARSCFLAALATFVERGERWGVAEAVAGVAVLAAAHGDAETAAELTGASAATYAEVAAQVIAPDARLAAPFLARARMALGEHGWSAALARGGGLSIDEAARSAMAYAGE
jgi:predicted ATPase/transcriptional regulator with XRE-family HTH domain